MAFDDRTRIFLPMIARLTLIGAVLGAAYGYVSTAGDHVGGIGLVRGALSGLLIALSLSSLDTFVLLPPGSRLSRAPFLLNVGARTLIYLAIFLAGIAIGQLLLPNHSSHRVVSISRADILFCFAVMLVVTFLFEVNRMIGHNVLLAFVTGRYHRPHVEERVFLIFDMKGSTAAAERLGEVGFHRLLSRLVTDLSSSVVLERGQIHKYAGDELIATWLLVDGVKGARCLGACFRAIGKLKALAPDYEHEFGQRVELRAALHCGPVVAGEMGSVKKEIVLLGDTLNTAARIVDACRSTGETVIASKALLDRLVVPAGLRARPLGAVPLRGKGRPVELVALDAAA
jgi:adenylate cyclase